MIDKITDYTRTLTRGSKLLLGLFLLVSFLGFNLLTASATEVNISAPQSVTATAGHRSVTVTWAVPSSLAGYTISGYQVEYSTTGASGTWQRASNSIAANATSYTITGLQPSQTYYTRVAALASNGNDIGAWGYPWQSIYKTTNMARNASGTFDYSSTYASLDRTDFSRVRYRLVGNGTYADVDFYKALATKTDASEQYDSLYRLQVPVPNAAGTNAQFEIQATVSDLTVLTNSSVGNGRNISGRLEIWPWNYGPEGSQQGVGGNDSLYDYGDRFDASNTTYGHGSVQVHDLGASRTIFAWNDHPNAAGGEMGFGNNPAAGSNNQHPDWTFANNENTYKTTFSFESFANLAVTTPIDSLSIGNAPTFAVIGEKLPVTPTIQLKSGTNNVAIAGVTVTATASGSATFTAGTNTAVTDANGLATFSNLTVASGTLNGTLTISYSATGYTGTSSNNLPVAATPTSINVTTGGTETATYWGNNTYYSTTAAAVIRPSTLQAQLNAGKPAILKASTGAVTVTDAVSATTAGAGALVLDAATGVAVNASITSAGAVSAMSAGTSSSIQVSANITTTTLGKSILLKAANNVFVGTDSISVSLQTQGASAGVGGDINIWTNSDADATAGGSFKSGLNASFNTIGGSTTATAGGGQLHIAGGLDDGGSTVRSGRANNDGFPDGFARSTANTAIGIELGAYATNNSTTITTGGGRVTLFGFTSSNTDGLAANFGLNLNAGEGQIEMVGKSGAWALQLSRGNNNDPVKTVITSRSAISPAISITGETTATSGAVSGILSGYSNQHSGSVVIQALGAGGVNLKGISAGSLTAIALSSTAVLSASGAINIDAGVKGLLVNQVESGLTTGGFTHFGECPVTSCVNSLVTSSVADFNFVGDRFATWSGLNESTISTSGAVSMVPAVGSTAFTDFTNSSDTTTSRLAGMTFAGKISGLTFGREGDTSDFNLPSTKTLTINGPIRIFGRDVDLSGGLISTKSGSEIRVESSTGVYLHSSQTIQTAGGLGADVVMWGNKSDGGGAVYVANSTCVNTVGTCSPTAAQIASGGAKIIFGGGSGFATTDGRKFPSGSAKNDSRVSAGVQIGNVANSLVKIFSGGGDIKFSGSGTGYGILTYGGETVNSGPGKITLTGTTSGAGYQGVRLSAGSGYASYISSAAASAGNAIEISGTNTVGTAWATAGVMIHDGTRTTLNANGGGDIVITGRASASTNQNDVYIRYADILASEGDITIDGGPGTVQIDAGSVVSNFGSLSTDAVSAKGNVIIRGDSVLNDGGTTKVRTTGDLIVEPSGATWSGAYSVTWTSLNADVNNIRIGKSNGVSPQGANLTVGAQTGKGTLQVFGRNVSTGALTTTTNATADISLFASGTFTNTGVMTSTGNVSVTAGDDITIAAGITLSSAAKTLELKSMQDVIFNTTAKTIQTNGGPIVVWGNSDGGSGTSAGGCYLSSGNTFQTQGGDFVVAGGSTADTTTGYPAGYCKGTNVSSDPYSFGVEIAASITTSDGALTVKGETVDSSTGTTQGGIVFEAGSYTISTGAGAQNWSGKIAASDTNASNKYGVWIGNNSTKPSFTSTSGDIKFFGDATAGTTNQRRGILIYGMTVSSTDGDIVFEGRANDKTASYDILAGVASPISTTNGDISYIGSGTATVDLASISSTSKNFTASATNFDAFSATSVTATGPVIFESRGDTFAASVVNATGNFSTTGLTIAAGPSSIRIGKPGNTKNVTLVSALTAGQISVYGGDIALNNDLVSTSASGGLLAKATGAITTTAGSNTTTGARKFSTAGGDITFWAGSDGSGSISIPSNTVIDSNTAGTTGGGDITIGGGTDANADDASKPAGPVVADSGNALQLGNGNTTNGVQISARGGKVYLGGKTNSTSTTASGLWYTPGLIVNAGEIELYGETKAASTTDNTASGIFSSANADTTYGTDAPSTFTATDDFDVATDAIVITSNATCKYSSLIGNFSPNTFSATGDNAGIKLVGDSSVAGGWGVWIGNTTMKTTSGNITVDAGEDVANFGRVSGDRPFTFGDATTAGNIEVISNEPTFEYLLVNTTGAVKVRPVTGESFAAAVSFPNSTTTLSGNETGLTVGSPDNTAAVTVGKATSVKGDISYYAGTLTVSNALTANAAGKKINLLANETEISAAITSGTAAGTGVVELAPQAVATPTVLGGTAAAGQLDLSDTELDYITAATIRLGSVAGTTSGNISVAGTITIADTKATNLALRTTGTIAGNGTIAVKNLGLLATSVTFGTSPFGVTGNLAIDATGTTAPTFKNSVEYTPSSVDSIEASYGTPTKIDLANVPTTSTLDAYMNVAFNPPPTLTLRDKYDSTLHTLNKLADTTTITAAVGTGSSTLAGTLTETSVDGVVTFDDLKFTAAGSNTIKFTSTTTTAATFDTTTGTFEVKAGDPSQLIVATPAASGRSDLAFGTQPVIHIADDGGNLVVLDAAKSLVVTATLTGGTGTLIGDTTVAAVNAVATFTDLGIKGLSTESFTITYTVTYNGADISEAQSGITVTYGNAAALAVATPAAGFVNRTDFTTAPSIEVQDSAGNKVTNAVYDVAVVGTGVTLTGTTTVRSTAGVATFTGLGKYGQIGIKTLTFSNRDLTSTTQDFELTHGAATQLGVAWSPGVTNNTAFGSQPVVTIKDQDGNTVTTGAQSTQTVALTATGAELLGTTSMAAVAGVADFAGKNVGLKGTTGSKVVTATINSPSTITGTQNVTIYAGAAYKLAFTTAVATPQYNRTVFGSQPVLAIQDISGNPTTATTTVTATATGANFGDGASTMAAAVSNANSATFSGMQLRGTAGTVTIEFSAPGLQSITSQSIQFRATQAIDHLQLELPTTAANGATLGSAPKVTFRDADDNLVDYTSLNGTSVTLSSDDVTLAGTLTATSTLGVVEFSGVTMTSRVGTGKVITATTAAGKTGTASIEVTFGAATQLSIYTQALATTNRAEFSVQPVIEVQDSSGNRVFGDTSEVSVAVVSGATLSGDTTVSAVDGRATFTDLGIYGTAGTREIIFSSGSLSQPLQNVTFTHGAAHHLTVTAPSALVNGAVPASKPYATIQDQDGNTVLTGANSELEVVFSSSDAELFGDLSITSTAGVATLGTDFYVAATIGTRSLKADVTSPITLTGTGSIEVQEGAATRLVLTRLASNAVAGTASSGSAFAYQPKLKFVDLGGNYITATTAASISVAADRTTLSVKRNSTTLTGTANQEFSYAANELLLTGTIGSVELTYSGMVGGAAVSSVSQTLTLNHGSATQLVISAPASTVNDSVLATQPVVTMKDSAGNIVTGGYGDLDTITISNNGDSAYAVSGAVSMDMTDGVANFADNGVKLTGLVGARTLKVQATQTSLSATHSITITYGAATKLTLVTEAAGFVNRTDFDAQPVVEVQDVSGNKVENSDMDVVASISDATLTGTTTIAATGGTATFARLGKYGTVGSKTLTFSAQGLTADSQTFTLTHGAAHQLQVTAAAAGAVNGVAFTTQPVIEIQDQDGNLVNTGAEATQEVTVEVVGAVLAGTATEAAVGGVADFAGNAMKLTGIVGDYTLNYEIASPRAIVETQQIELTFGAATQLVLVTDATGFVNRTDFDTQPVVEIQDASGNLVTSSAAEVTVAMTGGTLTGTKTVTAANGVATFDGLGKYGMVGSKTLTFSSASLTTDTQTFDLTYGAVHHLALTTPAAGFVNDVAFSTQPVITIQDEDNNTVESSTATVTASTSVGAVLGGTVTQEAVAGVASFSGNDLKLTGAKGAYTLTYSIAGPFTKTQSATLLAGAAHHLALITDAAGAKSRQVFATQPVIEVRDVSNNPVSNSGLTIRVSVAGATLNGTADAPVNSAGRASFTDLSLQGALSVSGYTVTYAETSGTLTSLTQSLPLAAGAATKLAINQSTITAASDATLSPAPVVTIQDADGNTVVDENKTIEVVIAGPDASTNSSAVGFSSRVTVNGATTFTGTKVVGVVGTHTLTYKTADSSLTAVEQQVTITPGAATKLSLTTPAEGFENRAEFTTQPVVKVLDSANNVVTSSTASVTVTISNATLTGTNTVAAVNGVAEFTNLGKYGSVTGTKVLTFTSPDLVSVEQAAFTLTPGAVHHIAVTTAAAGIANDIVFATQPVVTIQDQDDNTVTSASATVTASSTGTATLSGTSSMPAVNGVANFAGKGLKLTGLVGANTLSFGITDPAVFTDTQAVNLVAGTATKLVLVTEAAGFVNRTAFGTQPVVEVQDVSGNLVTGSTIAVDVEISDATLTGNTQVDAVAGVATFSGLGKYGTVGSKTLTFSAGILAQDDQVFTLTHGEATQLKLISSAASVRAGAQIAETKLEIQDQDGNLVTTGEAATARVSVAAARVAGGVAADLVDTGFVAPQLAFNRNAVAGEVTFSGLTLEGIKGAHTLEYAVEYPSEYAALAETQNIELTPGVAAEMRIVEQPTNTIANVAFTPEVQVEVVDQWQNRVTQDAASIKPVLVNSADVTEVLDGAKTAVAASQGLVTFSSLSFTKASNAKLRFESTGLPNINSAAFIIGHGEAHHLAWQSVQPTTVRSGFVIQPAPVFAVQDAWNNPVTSGDATQVTASVSSGNSADVLAIDGGVASTPTGSELVDFDALALIAKTGDYTLRFTANNDGKAIDGEFIETTSDLAITFGLPDHIELSEASGTIRAGFEFADQPVVRVLDSANNVVAEDDFTVTASLPAGVPMTDQQLTGTTAITATNGVADFASASNKLGVRGEVASGLNLRFTATNGTTTFVANQTFDLTPGLASSLRFVQQPSEVKRGAAILPAPTVELLDASGNLVTADSQTQVAVTVMARDADLDASNDVVAEAESAGTAAVNGVVTFTDVVLDDAPATDGYYLKARMGGVIATSDNFTLTAGEVAEVAILEQPSTTDAQGNTTRTGELLATQPKVELLDDGGYRVVNQDSGTVSVAVSSGSGGSLSEGSVTASVIDGVATFSGVKLVGTVATVTAAGTTPGTAYKLKFTFNSIDSADSNALTVRNNVAHHLAAVRAPGVGQAGVQLSGDDRPQVEIRDRFNNRVLDDSGLIRVSVAVASGSGTPSVFGSTSVPASSGLATFGIGVGGLTTNSYTFSYAYLPSATVSGTSQTGVTITDGDVYQLVATTAPATVDGVNQRNQTGEDLKVQPVLEFRDQWNNLVEAANGSSYQVTAELVDAIDVRDRLEGVTETAVNGVVTYDELKLIGRPGENYRLDFKWTVDSTVYARTADDLQVTHGDANHLTIVTQPASQTLVGGVLSNKTRTGDALAIAPVVEVRDFDDNIVTGLTSGEFLTATVSTGGGAANAVYGPVTNSDQAEIINGVANFAGLKIVALPNTDQKLTFSGLNPPLTSAESNAFQLSHAAAAKLAVTQQPCSGEVVNGTCTLGPTAGALAVQPVVQVQDRFSNPVPDFVGDVTASISGADGTLTNSANPGERSLITAVSNGLASFNGLEITGIPGADYALNFSTTGLTGVSSVNVQVTHSTATKLVMVRQPIGAETGALLGTQPVVRLADFFGNTVTADSTTEVTVDVSGGTLFKADQESLTATAVNGVVTFTGLKFRGTPGADYQLSFASGDLAGATSTDFNVTHAAMNQLVWSTQPRVGQTGEDLTTQPVLIMQDFDGNTVTSDNTTVVTATVATGVGGSVRNATATAAEGVVSFEHLQLVGTPGVEYTLNFTAVTGGASFSAPASEVLSPAHARPAALTMRTPSVESGFLSGAAPSNQPKLVVRDAFGNMATSDNSTVVTARIGAGSGGSVSGNTSARAVNGLIDFSGLVISGDPGEVYTLEFVAATSDSRSFRLLDSTTFTMDVVASAQLSYVDQRYVPVGEVGNLVAATFSTNSTAAPVFSTTAAASVCLVNASTGEISIQGVGSCPVIMTVPAATHYRTNSVVDTFVISKAEQADVVITSVDNVDFWSTLTPTATGGSSSATGYVFSVDGTCTLIGGKVLPGNAGSDCVLFAFKRGDANYLTSAVTEMTIAVNKIAQNTLRIGNLLDVNVGDVELFTTGGSGEGAVAYNVISVDNNAGCAIISGANGNNILRATANGTCRVQATKAESLNYTSALSATKVFTFTKQDQVVTFTSTIPMNPVVTGTYTPVATPTSSLAVTYSITAGQGTVCDFDAVDATKINFLAVGVCEVRASQAGDAQFNSAYATQRITVGALNQTINFAELANKRFNDPGFYLAATSNSGLPVSYQLGAGVTSPACQLVDYPGVGTFVRYTSAGFCEITATQAGNATYLPAPPVTRLFEITPDFAGKPKVTSISAGNQWYTVSFRAPSYLGGSSVLGYLFEITDVNGDIYSNAACAPAAAAAGADLSCTITGIPNGVAYTAKVAAITRAGLGLFSDVVGPLTPMAQTQGVTNLISYVDIVDASDRSLDELIINFDEPLATDSSVVGYQVYIAPAGTTNYGDPILVSPSANLTTSVLVSSIEGPGSAENAQTDTASFRSASAFRTASFRTAAVSPSPTPSPSASAQPLTGYSVKVVTITADPEFAADSNDYVTEGVHLGLATPSQPRALDSVVDDAGGKKINLAWVTPESDGGDEISGYRVRIEGGAELEEIVLDDEIMNYTVNEVQLGKTYVIKVSAINVNGTGAEATVTEIIPAPPTPPAPVTPSPSPTSSVSPKPTPSPTGTGGSTPRPTPTSSVSPSPGDGGTSAGGQKPVDTDGDGIENNLDPDIDGDGIVNGEDPDIDGDGIANGEDADPTGTTGAKQPEDGGNGGKSPIETGGKVVAEAATAVAMFVAETWPWFLACLLIIAAVMLWIKRRQYLDRD